MALNSFLKIFQLNIAANQRRAKEPGRIIRKGGVPGMSVIGRLDDQVEEVLIAPIARRHERNNKEREGEKQSPSEEERPAAAKEKGSGGDPFRPSRQNQHD
jgi:hypothetical protein